MRTVILSPILERDLNLERRKKTVLWIVFDLKSAVALPQRRNTLKIA